MSTSTQIEPSPEYLTILRSFVHPVDELQKGGFTVAPLTEGDLLAKRRCERCGSRQKRHFRERKPRKLQDGENAGETANGNNEETARERTEDGLSCKFHTGRLQFNTWTCCNQARSSKPCSGTSKHEMREFPPGELTRRWQHHPTPQGPAQNPPITVASNLDFPALPEPGSRHHGRRRQRKRASSQNPTSKRLAVAIDCEMGTSCENDSELIRITLVDYFTGESLLDRLVWPSVPMLHYNTRYSGVTRQQMVDARRMRQCIEGMETARKRVWQFVGPDTVVVGHGTQNDLAVLRWIHHTVVDSFLIENKLRQAHKMVKEEEEAQRRGEEEALRKELGIVEQEPKDESIEQNGVQSKKAETGSPGEKGTKKPRKRAEGGLSLKALAQSRLRRVIQTGNRGHDSMEDAIAARDIVDWHIRQAMIGTWQPPSGGSGAT